MKKWAAWILALALCLSLGVPALAAGGTDEFTAVKTNVRADSVANFEGYGAVAMSTDQVDGYDRPLMQSALIDANGRFLFPYTLNQDTDVTFQYVYSEGFVTVSRSSAYERYSSTANYYNLDGSVALSLPVITDQILARLMAEDTNPDFDPIVDASFWVSPFHDGVAFVRERYIVDRVRVTPSNGYESGAVGTPEDDVYRAYLMDTQGNILCELPQEFSDYWVPAWQDDSSFWAWCGTASEGLIPFVIKGYDYDMYFQLKGFGYIDYNGQVALDMMGSAYSNRSYFSDGLAWAKVEATGLFGYIDKSGELVIPAQYEDAYVFNSGFAAVKRDGKWGAIDTSGNVLIPFLYDDSFGTSDGYMTVGLNGKYGLVDRSGNVVVPLEYDDISTFAGGVAYGIKNGYVYVITRTNTAYASTQTVTIDGRPVELQAYALKDENGNPTNYVKLRDVAYALNNTAAQFEVGWDGSVNILTGKSYTPNGSEMSTPFSGDRGYSIPSAATNINGAKADLAAIFLTDDSGGGYTYYQLRDLGKALGFNVGWSAERGIFIETGKPYTDAD
ncbi:MAG: WG repeat-containing protein [Oscillospiraceae bacterium]